MQHNSFELISLEYQQQQTIYYKFYFIMNSFFFDSLYQIRFQNANFNVTF